MSSPLTVYADASDGYISSYDNTYNTARSGGGSVSAVTDGKYVIQGQASGYYYYLSYIQFDTSSAAGYVSVAELTLYEYYTYRNQAFTAWVAQYDWGASLTTGDFVAGDDLSDLTKVASIASADIATDTYNTFDSESAFLTAINVDGYTRLILFTNRMESGDAPTTGANERALWCSADTAGTDKDPKLYIEYDVAQQITPTGIGSAEAFGSPSVEGFYVLQPSGIASAEAFGSPSALPGAVAIQPTGIASAEAFGSPILAWISYKKRAFLGWVVSASPRSRAYIGWDVSHLPFIYPTGIASAEAFGSPSVEGFYVLQPSGIASAEAFGSPSVEGFYVLQPSGIASQEAFGSPFVLLEPVPVLMSGKCYIHLVTGGLVLLQPILKGEVRIR